MPSADAPVVTSDDGFPVMLVSGFYTRVQADIEVEYLEDKVRKYTEHNHFANISDIQDVDRLLLLELQVFRMAYFLNRGARDYDGTAVDGAEHRRSMAQLSNEIRQTKKILGIDKAARDHERGENSLPNYLAKLKARALDFGIHRDGQNCKILELGMQLIAMAQYHKNTTPEEQRELGITLEDLYKWVLGVFTPELMTLDEHFRENQRIWIQEM